MNIKKIYIHIGWHKTGSTSVQNFLLKNRKVLREQQKIYYPHEGLLTCAHHTIAWAFQGREISPWGTVEIPAGGAKEFIASIRASADQNRCDRIILSSEEFCTYKKDEMQALQEALAENRLEPTIIAYIRRQDQLIESSYNMEVKWWGSRLTHSFEEYVKSKRPFTRFAPTLWEWASIFGRRKIIVRPFSPDLLEEGDVRIDFCDVVSIDRSTLEVSIERVNDSLATKTVEFLRLMNNLNMSRDEHERIVEYLFKYDKEKQLPKCVFFTPEERVKFMSSVDSSNAGLFHFNEKISFILPPTEQLPERNVGKLSLDDFIEISQFTGVRSQ